MGSSIGAAVKTGGREVYWLSGNRSAATARRAAEAEFRETVNLSNLVTSCNLIISVCPPSAAEEVAAAVGKERFSGVYVDANAVSPAASRRIGAAVQCCGASYVDGGIIGPPAWTRGSTRLYLSGGLAGTVAEIFTQSPLQAVVLEGPAGRASALKMTYAAYTKGTTALIGAILAVAQREGVLEMLKKEWSRSLPELAEEAENRVRRTTAKAWRFAGEMEQIASTFAGAGLPDGFHRAAATLYARQARFKNFRSLPPLAAVLEALMDTGKSPADPNNPREYS
jgi:3-hydroxyisobutyrate dehydrogenase-like beta-hydroxyacid dehydrogenase